MGSCVSLSKDSQSALKLRLDFGSKTDKLVNPSPDKEKPPMVADGVIKSHWSPVQPVTPSRHFGSKEETFFDSQLWLESDCEDDFLSVNGDFTPSRGNTPVHHSFSVGTTPRSNGQVFTERNFNSIPEPSPTTDKKKRLAEFFKDSIRNDQDVADDQKVSTAPAPAPNPYASEVKSEVSSERSPTNGDFKQPGEKSAKSAQCCLPRLRGLSLRERKKKTNPASSVG